MNPNDPTRNIIPEQEQVTVMLNKSMVEQMRLNNGWSGPVQFAFEDTTYNGMVMWLRNTLPMPDYALVAEEAERKGIVEGERKAEQRERDKVTVSLEHYKKIQQRRRELENERMNWQRMTGVKDPIDYVGA